MYRGVLYLNYDWITCRGGLRVMSRVYEGNRNDSSYAIHSGPTINVEEQRDRQTDKQTDQNSFLLGHKIK